MEDGESEVERQKWTSARKSTRAARRVRELVREQYQEGAEALAEGRPVAWSKAALFRDFCRCLGITLLLPENYAGLCATKRANDEFIEAAEAEGYSNVMCTYARTGLGYARMMAELGAVPPGSPDGGLAYPTVLLDSTAPCDPHLKWFQAQRRYTEVPWFMLEEPEPVSDLMLRDDVRDHYIKYRVDLLRRLVEFLERLVGRKMDWDKFEEEGPVRRKANEIFQKALQFRKAIPCPMPTEDMMNLIVPSMMLGSDPRLIDFYQDLYDELKYRVENKIGVIPEEKYRLIWGTGLPPWHSMGVFNWVEEQGAVFVYDLCYGGISEDPYEELEDIKDPLERMVSRDYRARCRAMKRSRVGGYNFIHSSNPLEWIEPFQADGVVFHWLTSCRNTTVGSLYYENLIHEYSDVPTLHLESDICDVHAYSEADWKRNILAFLEVVDGHKERRGGSPRSLRSNRV